MSSNASCSGTSTRQYAFRAIKSYGLVKAWGNFDPLTVKDTNATIRHLAYAANGSLVALAASDHVKVMNCSDGAEAFTISDLANVFEVQFSLDGKWLSTWERPIQNEDGTPSRNLKVWDSSNGTLILALSQKSQHRWSFQFHERLPLAVRMVTNEVHIYDASSSEAFKSGIKQKLRVEGVTQFALSPGRNPSIAVFVGEKKGAPAIIRIHQLLAQSNSNDIDVSQLIPSPNPSAQKSFFKADKVELQWNAQGTAILVGTQTEVDKTGKSYYGETNLYLLAAAGNFDCRITLDRDGPIHDVKWAPNSREFTVVYGFMPAKTSIFDGRANTLHSFSLGPRNMASYNAQGRLLLVAGLGNLAGACDVYDRSTLKKLTTIEASNSSVIEWSPDGRLLMTATMSPRLRVDNGIKIWHAATGQLIHEQSIDELYQIAWRSELDLGQRYPFQATLSPPPSPTLAAQASSTKMAHGSTSSTNGTSKPASGAYKPPHMRVAGYTKPAEYFREDQEGYVAPRDNIDKTNGSSSPKESRSIPGMKNLAPSKAVNKKTAGKQQSAPATDGTAQNTEQNGQSGSSDVDKRTRNIQKKLKSIAELKDKKQRGEPLEKTQLAKLDTESALRKELEGLLVN